MKTSQSLAVILLCSISLTGCRQAEEVAVSKEATSTTRAQGVIHVSSATQFDDILKDNENVLVDFYATWCGPCKRLGPVIDELAKEINHVTFVKIDVDQANAISSRYGVRSIPTIIFFKNGNKVKQETGFKSKNDLRNLINNTF
jgi:thioredoxin 1